MIHKIEIDDSTETGKLVLEFLNGIGMGSGKLNPGIRNFLLNSLKESEQGNLKTSNEVFTEIKQWLHSK